MLEKIKLHQKKENIYGTELNQESLGYKNNKVFSFKKSSEKSFTL